MGAGAEAEAGAGAGAVAGAGAINLPLQCSLGTVRSFSYNCRLLEHVDFNSAGATRVLEFSFTQGLQQFLPLDFA